jgi:hypothetical protein
MERTDQFRDSFQRKRQRTLKLASDKCSLLREKRQCSVLPHAQDQYTCGEGEGGVSMETPTQTAWYVSY